MGGACSHPCFQLVFSKWLGKKSHVNPKERWTRSFPLSGLPNLSPTTLPTQPLSLVFTVSPTLMLSGFHIFTVLPFGILVFCFHGYFLPLANGAADS